MRSDEVGRVISLDGSGQQPGEHADTALARLDEDATGAEEEEEEEGVEESEEEEASDEKSAAAVSRLTERLSAADDSVQGCFSHLDSVYCVEAFGDVACSGDGNDTALLWNTHTGDVMHTLAGRTAQRTHTTKQHRRLKRHRRASRTHSRSVRRCTLRLLCCFDGWQGTRTA